MRNNLEDLADRLVCPGCRSRVRLNGREYWCQNPDCRRSYPIVRMEELDVPQMLIELSSVREPESIVPDIEPEAAAQV